jgi:hypothetical protein
MELSPQLREFIQVRLSTLASPPSPRPSRESERRRCLRRQGFQQQSVAAQAVLGRAHPLFQCFKKQSCLALH